jgi:O-antigen/teichoic acid export membrane protein
MKLSALFDRARAAGGKARASGLAGETAWGFVFEAVTVVGMLFSFTILGRSLGPDRYGQYISVYAIVAPAVTLAASGVTLALMQHIVRNGDDTEEAARSCVSISLALGSLMTVVGIIVAQWVVEGLGTLTVLSLMATEFVTLPIAGAAQVLIQVRDGFIAATKVRIWMFVARPVTLLVLFLSDTVSIGALGACYLSVSLGGALLLARRTKRDYGVSMRPGRLHLRHLRTSLTYSGGTAGAALQNDGDKAVLSANRLTTDTGLYSAAYRIVQLGQLPINALTNATHVRFLEHDEGQENQHFRRSMQFTAMAAAYGVAFAIGIIIVSPLLPFLLGDDFEGSVTMVVWLSPLVLIRGFVMFPLNGLMGLNKTSMRTALLLASAAVSMVMYIVLIPEIGWKGAALGTLVGEGLLAVAAWTLLVFYQRKANAKAAELRTSQLFADSPA